MAEIFEFYRNFDSTDAVNDAITGSAVSKIFPNAAYFGWEKTGESFVGWNTSRDGSGEMHNAGDALGRTDQKYYAIWKEARFGGLINATLLAYFKSKLDGLFNKKVDKVDGKGLSSNDFTDADVSKLSAIETGAQVNKIETIKVNGTAQTVTSKAVDITVPTKTSELTNNSNFVSDANYVHTDNNFTNTDKTKLSDIASGAQVNKIETVKVNGTALTITDKAVDVTVPTNTSDLTNDSGFITAEEIPEGAAASTTVPKMDGTAATGTELAFARGDHVHPKDTSKADLDSPTFTGVPKAPTAEAGTNTTQVATTAFVKNAIDGSGFSKVYVSTGTIGTSATSAVVQYKGGDVIGAYATQGGNEVVVDISVGMSEVTFSVASAPTSAITCVVVSAT